MNKNKHEFNDALAKIVHYLADDRDKGDYILLCFYKQETYDIQEMEKTEGNITLVERYETMMETRNEQINQIRVEMKNFKNEKFKVRVAELLQWVCLQMDFPDSYENHFSKELRIYLGACKRYNKDMIQMAQDVNTTFKSLSPKPDLPSA